MVVYPEESTCLTWARIRHERFRLGRPLQPEDAWIAATALDIGCPLLTHGAGDFADIAGLEIISAPA